MFYSNSARDHLTEKKSLAGYPSHNLTPIPQIYTREYHHNQLAKIKENPSDNKSFLDGFDNNNSSYLNQNKSFAHNFKGRLMNYEDPHVEKLKEERVKSYRQDLMKQMENDKVRKLRVKKQIEEEELRREKNFYDKVKIQAQLKIPEGKEGNAYYMMRTNYKRLREEKQKKQQRPQVTLNEVKPKISKRAYHNRSMEAQPRYQEPSHEEEEKRYEEERMIQILSFQESMLKKLELFRTQIRNTQYQLETMNEVDRVRSKLKSNPVYAGLSTEKKVQTTSNSDFYSLPKRSPIKLPKSKYNDLKANSIDLGLKKKVVRYNDKNFEEIEEQNPEFEDH